MSKVIFFSVSDEIVRKCHKLLELKVTDMTFTQQFSDIVLKTRNHQLFIRLNQDLCLKLIKQRQCFVPKCKEA